MDNHKAIHFKHMCIPLPLCLYFIPTAGQGQLHKAQPRSLLSHSHPVQGPFGGAQARAGGVGRCVCAGEGLGKWSSHLWLATKGAWKPSLENNERRNVTD